ncbi:hypothetical protein J6590_049785 [Homalodisca vitripennis]|nr:hypothetical protein J6590_049785 [Homalodisca vitripennis]
MCGDSRGAVLTTRTHTLSRSLKILSQIRSHTVCPRTGLGCSVPATAKVYYSEKRVMHTFPIQTISPRQFGEWSIVRGRVKQSRQPLDTSLTEPVDIIDQLNSYFTTISEETLRVNLGESENRFEFRDWEVESPTMSYAPTSERLLLGIITPMKRKKSAGTDDMYLVAVCYLSLG